MPSLYDAVASSVELQAKLRVVSAFQSGSRLLEPGELGLVKECEQNPVLESTSKPAGSKSEDQDGDDDWQFENPEYVGDDIRELVESSPCKKVKKANNRDDVTLKSVVQVENLVEGRLHLYDGSFRVGRSVCNLWACGVPDKPSRHADFYRAFDTVPLEACTFSAEYTPCSRCFSVRLLKDRGWDMVIPYYNELVGVKDVESDAMSSVCSSDSSASEP